MVETFDSYTPYNYCLNNPVLMIDPNGMASTYNWDRKRYENEKEEEVSWSDVQKEYGVNSDQGGAPGNANGGIDDKKKKAESTLQSNSATPGQTSATTSVLPLALTLAASDGLLPIGDVIGATILFGAATYDLAKECQRTYVTYILHGPNGRIYVGRASGFGTPEQVMWQRYRSHHMVAYGYKNPTLDRSAIGYPLGYYAIRGREQDLIDANGGIGGPKLGNSINAIWEYNPNKPLYLGTSKLAFGPVLK